MAQFMVANKLSARDVAAQAADSHTALNLPTSVVEFLQGQLGQPTGGFPEPLRAQVLAKAGLPAIATRPGAELPPLDFAALKSELTAAYGELSKDGFALRLDQDALSAALYPQASNNNNNIKKRHAHAAREARTLSRNCHLQPPQPQQQPHTCRA